jgi:hypothetical protein
MGEQKWSDIWEKCNGDKLNLGLASHAGESELQNHPSFTSLNEERDSGSSRHPPAHNTAQKLLTDPKVEVGLGRAG